MALFWPDSETQLAQSALRNTLARLKNTLGAAAPSLLVDRDRVGFDFAADYTLDLTLVNQAVNALRRSPPAIAPTLSLLQAAARAARGPFLDGFSLPDTPEFDLWITSQRAAWGRRLDLVYDRLSLQQLEARQFSPAIEMVAHWISLDRLNEVAYRRLMRLHFLNGDRAAALQTYDLCRSLLIRELGVEPAPLTEELLANIRASAPSAPLPSPTSSSETRTPLDLPLVGRASEHEQLAQLYTAAVASQAQVVAVIGESGLGKTRLATEFLTWAGLEGADVLQGRAFETAGQLPYQPVIDALRTRLERENAPDDLLDDVWLAELARLLPELRERYPDLPAVTGAEATARSRLFEVVARLGQALAVRRPMVWVIDDMQWADAGTLELLHYLTRRWHENRTPILLILLLRQEALMGEAALRDWLTGLGRETALTRLTLAPISAEGMHQLVVTLAGEEHTHEPAAGVTDLAAWLLAETEGQPFFIAETLAALNDYGALVWRSGAAAALDPIATLANLKSQGKPSLAPSIRDVILARLARLSQAASGLLAAAAVIDRDCTFARLGQVSGSDELNGLNALDELLSARLILEASDEARPYTISHDRIREVVYAELSEARQQVYHRRALAALTEANAAAAELAYHALAAKQWDLAFCHSLEAGDEAMHVFAVALATHHYENALRLLREERVQVDTPTCQRLYTRQARSLEMQDRHEDALGLFQELQRVAAARGSREMELAARLGQGGGL